MCIIIMMMMTVRHAAAPDTNAAAAAVASMTAEGYRGSREWAAPQSSRSHFVPTTDRRQKMENQVGE